MKSFHILSIDVEDWAQSTLNHSFPISARVVRNTELILDVLAKTGSKATFFVLGKVAEAYPRLAREISEAGHEVGTHGYSHEAVETLPVPVFRQELRRSVDVLRQQIGREILGHRAADFSISSHSLHLLDILADEGIAYDSSIFPIRHPRYGVPGAWRHPHRVRCSSGRTLFEFPVATLNLGSMIFPGAGGGYLRLFPFWWTNWTIQQLEREGSPATCYLHPYEMDPLEMREIPYKVPFLLRLSQSANRRTVKQKLENLISRFRFVTMAAAYNELKENNLPIALDLTQRPWVYSPQAA